MNKSLEGWSLEDISMVDKMNFEPNVMQLVILHNMYTVFFSIANSPPRTSQAFSTQTSTQLHVIDGLYVKNIVLMVIVTTFLLHAKTA